MNPLKPNPGECLADLYPDLADEWHPTKNNKLTPYNVTPHSNKKVWWICPKGDNHEWNTSINNRTTGTGCPFCTNKRIILSNCLATLNPNLAKQWHPTKNEKLTPYDVGPGSGKKVWWICPEGDDHEWRAQIASRDKGSGCPVCANQKAVLSNCLATLYPDLAKQWHPSKNLDLTPYEVLPGSSRKVWWKCPKGDDHEYWSQIRARTIGTGCPVCAGKKTVKSNSLATLNPILARQWHPINNGNLTPNDVTCSSHKKVWWKCPKGDDHEWQATVKGRHNGRGCAICAGKIVVKSNSLVTLNPNLAKQWHPNKNGNFRPENVTRHSHNKVWWKCPKGDDHEWEAKVSDRNRGDGCPVCANQKVVLSNCLATVNPELAKEWHPTKNGEFTPYQVTPGSNIKVWWKCPNGDKHEWKTSIARRKTGTGCPICSNKKIILSNCLETLNPSLAKEWHPHKNGKLTPFDVGPGSNKKVWWKCPKGEDHEWEATVALRNNGVGCSICANRTTVPSNSLATLNPELAKEWHPSKNGNLTPLDVHPGSNKIVWWKCDKGNDHEWRSSVLNRSAGSKCTICGGKKAVRSNCLATLNPELAKEWHPTKNGQLTPYDITLGSGKRIWWKCSKGEDHEWKASMSSRNKGSGCPVCTNLKAVLSNCLATLNPELVKQWHPTKNGNLTPYDITSASGKKVWWKCHKGNDHVWNTTPYHRTIRGSGCPYCTNPSSAPELRILCEIRTIFPSTEHRVYIKGHEIDILIPELKIGIEYDGEYWHRNKIKQDRAKNNALSAEILLLRIREKGLPLLSETDIQVKTREFTITTMKRLFQLILDISQIKSLSVVEKIKSYNRNSKWIAPEEFRKLRAARNHIEYEESIAFLNPEISEQWHPEKNKPLLPEYFSPGSHKKIWWKCPKGDDHEWEAPISNRTLGKSCPICSGRKTVKSNCLATLNPELAIEWHPKRNNELTPYDVRPGSAKKVWWKCPKGDDHEWQALISSRNKGVGCPICSNYKTVKSNSLATLNPELAKEWHPDKNGNITPYDVNCGSHKKVWWKCKKGDDHEWETEIRARVRGQGCPVCANKKTVKSNCLATVNPELAKEWHPTRNGELTPDDVTCSSHKKVWWKAKCGHDWPAVINKRAIRGQGCPKCRYKKASRTIREKQSKGQLRLFE